MRFLVDSAVSPLVSTLLSQAGHDSVHVREYGLQSASDATILERAAAENRVLLSADADFGTLLAQYGADRPSLILFRRTSGNPRPEFQLLSSILALSEVQQELNKGCIVVLEPGRIRIRNLPIQREPL